MRDGKSDSAFRTISEVGQALDLKPHVLRFWEGKFADIQPVKRGNGRRYYRPEDVALIAGIKHLLHERGMTIKGAQKFLKDEGVAAVRAAAEAGSPSPTGATNESLTVQQKAELREIRETLAGVRKMLIDG